MIHNSILPEVRNSLKHKKIVAKGKRISVYFDRTKGEFVGLDEEQLKKLRESYASLNVDSELKKMSVWLLSVKGARRKGDITFILNWLNNTYPTQVPSIEAQIEEDTPIRHEINSYLEGLWKGREHVLEMNKRKS